jgi:hypothetical protein
MKPPTAGPTTVPTCHATELNAIALGSSLAGTILGAMALSAGPLQVERVEQSGHGQGQCNPAVDHIGQQHHAATIEPVCCDSGYRR